MNEIIERARAAINEEDYGSAVDLLQPLANAGDREAQFLMGYLFFTAADVSKAASLQWLRCAAEQDHAEALYYLAFWDDSDACDFRPPADPQQRALLQRAAELGSAEAQRDLGCFYATGSAGFPQDEALGRLWYGRAAAQGHVDAQFNYGVMMLNGEGGPIDSEGGIEWVRSAAGQGDSSAENFLVEFYSSGRPNRGRTKPCT